MTNIRESPYSVSDGDVVAVLDRLEDPNGLADLSRADDEVCHRLKCATVPNSTSVSCMVCMPYYGLLFLGGLRPLNDFWPLHFKHEDKYEEIIHLFFALETPSIVLCSQRIHGVAKSFRVISL